MAIWSNETQLIEAGAEPLFTASKWHIFEKNIVDRRQVGYMEDEPSVEVIRRNLNRDRVQNRPIVVNIESELWPFLGHPGGGAPEDTRRKMRIVFDWVRELHPSAKVGFYAHVPMRDYYTPIRWMTRGRAEDLDAMNRWRKDNQANAEWLDELVDWVMPSIYHVLPRSDRHWTKYADAQIEQAQYSRRPVVPYMSILRHARTPLKLSEWRIQVEYARAMIDADQIEGVVLWGENWPEEHVKLMREVLL